MEHFPNNQYEISTSGYLLTEEKAKFFSYYGVHYVLSVDGTERVTNHLRPLANGELGYFKQFKNLKGHFGTGVNSTILDFATFPGAILLTKNGII